MNLSSKTWLSVIAWAFTLFKLRGIRRKDIRYGSTALNLWLMLFFFSITLTFLGEVGGFVDARVINNLSNLIAYPSILITIFLATKESLNAVDRSAYRRTIRWLGSLLTAITTVLLIIYVLFLWKVPEFTFVPRSIPEVAFRFIAFCFGAVMCVVQAKAYLMYYPLERSSILRLRALMVTLCAGSAFLFFLVRIAQLTGYFWPLLASETLNNLSVALLALSSLLYFSAFLNHEKYQQFVRISSSFERWRTFQDLKYLMDRFLRLCPEVVSPAPNPSFWRFVFNPEYYLYCMLIALMDSGTMLDDLMAEGTLQRTSSMMEENLRQELAQLKQVLRSIDASGDFWKIVNEYRYAGQELNRISNSLFRITEK
jgi:hypothetical protein